MQNFHALSLEQVLEQLQTSRKGLEKEHIRKALQQYGPNSITTEKKGSRIKKVLKQFKDYMIILLLVTAGISFYLQEERSAIILLIIVAFNAMIGFLQEYKAEKIMDSLKKLVHPYATVIREWKQQEIKVEDLVPGDLILLEEGKSVPADARVIESKWLGTNDFALTGESNPVSKYSDSLPQKTSIAEQSNMVFMGTTVAKWLGRAIVTATGEETLLGRIADLSQQTKSDFSPLQKEINNISVKLTIGTIIVWSILFVIATIVKLPTYEAFLFALGVGMSLVPQGMPAQISIALSLASNKLAKKNVVVKQLSSVETLGSTSIICTDKTGTLTKNEMTAQQMRIAGKNYYATGLWYKPQGKITDQDGVPVTTHRINSNKLLFLWGMLASTARIAWPDQYHSTRHTLGDPTEWALITLGEKAWFALEVVHQTHREYTIFPFDSDRKRMSSIRQVGGHIISFVKWSPESILSETTHILDHGKARPITQADKDAIKHFDDTNASNAMRNLAIAYKTLTENQLKTVDQKTAETHLTLVWIVSMIDPPREEVEEAMKAAYEAKIKVAIITGDYSLTAKAIAHKVWLDKDGQEIVVIKGIMLSKMSDSEIATIVQNQHVIFSRTSPEDKLRIVSVLKAQWAIVAVTGDGINDAPALKKADVWVAMWLTGSDVAKEAASLILLKDSFSDLVHAIREWRIIFENLKKTILSSLTSNGGELFVVLISLLCTGMFGWPIAIIPLLILAVDLLGEMLPLTALAWDPGQATLMSKKPRNPDKHIVEGKVLIDLIWAWFLMGLIPYTVFITKLLLDGQWLLASNISEEHYATAVSTTYVAILMCQYANILSRRAGEKSVFTPYFWSNKTLLVSFLISIVLVTALLYIPIINKALGNGPIGPKERLLAIAGWCVYLGMRELQKKRKNKKTKTD